MPLWALLALATVVVAVNSKASLPSCQATHHFSSIRDHDVVLTPTLSKSQIASSHSPIPCKQTYNKQPKNMFAPVRGQSCVKYHVTASVKTTVCFLPDVAGLVCLR